MKTRAMKRIGIAGLAFAAVIFLSGIAFAYMPEKEANQPPKVKPEGKVKYIDSFSYEPEAEVSARKEKTGKVEEGIKLKSVESPKYAPNVVLAAFPEGSVPEKVVYKARIPKVKSIKPTVNRAGEANKIRKEIKKDPKKGLYVLNGKSYKDPKDIPDKEAFEAAYKNMAKEKKAVFDIHTITFEGEDPKTVADRLMKAGVKAGPNYIYEAMRTPEDPKYSEQWALPNIGYEYVWEVPVSQPVTIAIVDSGVDYAHEDLADNMWKNMPEYNGKKGVDDDGNGFVDDIYGYDFYNRDGDPKDDHGHGTHCAGIAAARTNNGKGIAGVCPSAKIMAVKFLASDGRGWTEDAISGIVYAVENGAKVISNSWSGADYNNFLQDVINYAHDRGCVIVAAAGNYNTSRIFYPAGCDNVISVAAIDSANNRASFSNYGQRIDVAAPGVGILSTLPGNAYASWSGTSMACPHVAGEAAFLLAVYPQYSADNCANIIRMGAMPLDPGVKEKEYIGTGRINLVESLRINRSDLQGMVARISTPLYAGFSAATGIEVSGTALGGGGISSSGYALDYSTEPYGETWTNFASGISVSKGLLGNFDARGIETGDYFIKLKVFGPAGLELSNMTKLHIDREWLAGWPQEPGAGVEPWRAISMSPVCADFDNDGSNEVLAFSSCGWDSFGGMPIYLWRADGTPVSGWPKRCNGGWWVRTPAVYDIDGDGDLEIFIAAKESITGFDWIGPRDEFVAIHGFHHTGEEVGGWPILKRVEGSNTAAPSSIAIGDINGDTLPEIVTVYYSFDINNSANKQIEVCVFQPDGTVPGYWPTTIFRDKYNESSYFTNVLSNPALVDLNNDGREEIVFAYSESATCVVNALDYLGQPLAGWPRTFNMHDFDDLTFVDGSAPRGIASGDVNSDGRQELFFATTYGVIFGLDSNGNFLPGWPKKATFHWCISSISLVDLDNDRDLEIVVQSNEVWGQNVKVWAFHHGADLIAGWPKRIGNFTWGYVLQLPHFASDAVAEDIDNDGFVDIIIGSAAEQEVYALDGAGNIKSGFPKRLLFPQGVGMYATPSVVDLDKDGQLEFIAGDFAGMVYAYPLPGSRAEPAKSQWPVFGHDLRRSYSYIGDPVIFSVSPRQARENSDVTIIGTGFMDRGKVMFGSTPAVVNSWFYNKISAKVPDFGGNGGVYPLTVATDKGASKAVHFYVLAVPRILSVKPVSGQPGTAVGIAGVNFATPGSAPVVKFGSARASVLKVTDKLITCTVPGLAKGVYPLTVTTSIGTSKAVNFTVLSVSQLPKPTLLSRPGPGLRAR